MYANQAVLLRMKHYVLCSLPPLSGSNDVYYNYDDTHDDDENKDYSYGNHGIDEHDKLHDKVTSHRQHMSVDAMSERFHWTRR